jgi:hypothetical protein
VALDDRTTLAPPLPRAVCPAVCDSRVPALICVTTGVTCVSAFHSLLWQRDVRCADDHIFCIVGFPWMSRGDVPWSLGRFGDSSWIIGRRDSSSENPLNRFPKAPPPSTPRLCRDDGWGRPQAWPPCGDPGGGGSRVPGLVTSQALEPRTVATVGSGPTEDRQTTKTYAQVLRGPVWRNECPFLVPLGRTEPSCPRQSPLSLGQDMTVSGDGAGSRLRPHTRATTSFQLCARQWPTWPLSRPRKMATATTAPRSQIRGVHCSAALSGKSKGRQGTSQARRGHRCHGQASASRKTGPVQCDLRRPSRMQVAIGERGRGQRVPSRRPVG